MSSWFVLPALNDRSLAKSPSIQGADDDDNVEIISIYTLNLCGFLSSHEEEKTKKTSWDEIANFKIKEWFVWLVSIYSSNIETTFNWMDANMYV